MDSRGVMILEMPVWKRIPERNLSQAEEQPSSPKWRRPYLGWKKGFCFHLLASLRSCPSWYQLNLRERQRQQMMDWVQVRSSQMQELIRQYLLKRATAQNTIFSFLKGNSFCLFRLRMNSMNFYRYPCVNMSSLPVWYWKCRQCSAFCPSNSQISSGLRIHCAFIPLLSLPPSISSQNYIFILLQYYPFEYLFLINYPDSRQMSKKLGTVRYKPTKEENPGKTDKADPSKKKKRLKRLSSVNPIEEIIEPPSHLSESEPQFKQFQYQDDQGLRREKELQDNKSRKQPKNNSKLDTFITKTVEKKINPSKSSIREKPFKIQFTLDELAKMKNERARKKSFQSLNSHEGRDQEEGKGLKKQAEQVDLSKLQEFNGSNEDESKLVQKAMQLSMTAPCEKRERECIKEEAQEIKVTFTNGNASKEERHRSKSKGKAKGKEGKDKGKSKPKVQEAREGPFRDLVIAFTGEYEDYTRDEVEEVCLQLGAVCPKSLTKKVNLLMQGSFVIDHFKRKLTTPVSETQKSRDARQRNIKIISSSDIDAFFLQKTGFDIIHHINKNKAPTIRELFKNDSPPEIYQVKEEEPKPEKCPLKINQIPEGNLERSLFFNPPQDTQLWTEKYKPKRLDEVVGDRSQIKQLQQWLDNWHDIHIRGNKREVKGFGGTGNINSSAALLSGDPGIGKTTTARLMAMELNYMVSEFNASDIRNKSGVSLMESSSLNLDQSKNLQKPLIIMDQVDGMSSGDRGGITAIIQMIKTTKVPIICICNDRRSDKIRSLSSHCLDIHFHKPRRPQIVSRLKEILSQEGGKGEDRALDILVETFQNDMRQILSYLQLTFQTVSKTITVNAIRDRKGHTKDSSVMISHFEASRKLLNRSEFRGMKISERNDCFFVDSDLVPLMVEENLLASSCKNKMTPAEFRSFTKGIEGLVIGDMLDRNIRKQQEWGLMPSYGFMTCVYTTEKVSDKIGFPQFPSWLGKNSSERKNKRLSRELKNAIFPTSFCSSSRTVKQNYSTLLMRQIAAMLQNQRVEDSIDLMESYRITPSTLSQSLTILAYPRGQNSPLNAISTQVKAKLTRSFNKRHEDAKLKQKKPKKIQSQASDHLKFNPILEEMEAEEPEPIDQIKEEEEEEEIVGKKVKKGKKK